MAVQQQVTTATTTKSTGSWSTELFDICSDRRTCCLACCCFSRLQSQTASKHGWCSFMPLLDTLVYPAVTIYLRKSIREQYGIEGSLGNDVLLSYFCYPCVWCQMSRELENRAKTTVVTRENKQERNAGER